MGLVFTLRNKKPELARPGRVLVRDALCTVLCARNGPRVASGRSRILRLSCLVSNLWGNASFLRALEADLLDVDRRGLLDLLFLRVGIDFVSPCGELFLRRENPSIFIQVPSRYVYFGRPEFLSYGRLHRHS